LLEAVLYRISAVRSKFEQNNLSIAESFWVAAFFECHGQLARLTESFQTFGTFRLRLPYPAADTKLVL
jgi:hypothetical protein